MKWLAALLMISNVTIFLWFSGRHGGQELATVDARPDVNREGMLLLKEVQPVNTTTVDDDLEIAVFNAGDIASVSLDDVGVETVSVASDNANAPDNVALSNDSNKAADETGLSEQSANEEDTDDSAATLKSDNQADSASTAQADVSVDVQTTLASLAPPDLSCYRIGPFKQLDTWQTENSWMQQQGFAFEAVSTESRELRAVRVFLGPFASKQAASPTVRRLKEAELDHFVYEIEAGQARVSLGYFTQEELAVKFVNYIQSQGFEAQSQPEYRILGPYNWMEASIDSALRNQLLQREWSEVEVSTLEVECK